MKLQSVKSQLDIQLPVKYSHLKNKIKPELLREGISYTERYREIDRENQILLERMSKLQKKSTSPVQRLSKSLNMNLRKKHLKAITTENELLLKRLRGNSSTYSVDKWEKERESTENLLKNICEFPYILGHDRLKRPKRLPPLRPENSLYNKQISIFCRKFNVKIHEKTKNFLIAAGDVATNEHLELNVLKPEAARIMGNPPDFDQLMSRLNLINGKLVLVTSPVARDEEFSEHSVRIPLD